MIIPCIDLMGGKGVQLIQGKVKALELESLELAVKKFAGFPVMHVIDLDEAKGTGDNREQVRWLIENCDAKVRVGGGVRTPDRAAELLELGAHQVIVGSAAFADSGVDTQFLTALNQVVEKERIVIAVDCIGRTVAVKGWAETVPLHVDQAVIELEPFCGGFLCTCVEKEGMMRGTDLDLFLRLRSLTSKTLIAAGGITTYDEIKMLTSSNIEVALGMAIYTAALDLSKLRWMATS